MPGLMNGNAFEVKETCNKNNNSQIVVVALAVYLLV